MLLNLVNFYNKLARNGRALLGFHAKPYQTTSYLFQILTLELGNIAKLRPKTFEKLKEYISKQKVLPKSQLAIITAIIINEE